MTGKEDLNKRYQQLLDRIERNAGNPADLDEALGLLKQGADPLLHSPGEHEDIIHYAIVEAHEDMLREFLSLVPSPDFPDRAGRTPLHNCVLSKWEDQMEILLEHNASLSATDKFGWNALHLAAGSTDPSLAKRLLELGADVLARTKDGKTALDIARDKTREWGEDMGIADVLLEHVSKRNTRYLHNMYRSHHRKGPGPS